MGKDASMADAKTVSKMLQTHAETEINFYLIHCTLQITYFSANSFINFLLPFFF